jgi:hypothetical protein
MLCEFLVEKSAAEGLKSVQTINVSMFPQKYFLVLLSTSVRVRYLSEVRFYGCP